MKRLFAVALLVVVLTAAVQVAAEEDWTLEPGDIELRALAKKVSEITDRVVIYGSDFSGTVELAPARRKMSKKQVWEYFLSVLASQGYGVVVRGDIAQIVPLSEMATQDQPVLVAGEQTPEPSDQMVTVTFDLEHAEASAVAMQLSALVGGHGKVIPIPSQNRVVVVDTAANIERLRKLVERLDADGATESIQVVRLKKADAEQMSQLLAKVFTEYRIDGNLVRRRRSAGGLIVVPEPTGQSIVLRGDKRDVDAAVALARKIDAMPDPVVAIQRLQNADPEQSAKLLRDLVN